MYKKTNAMRILDKAKIPYEVKEYEFELSDLSAVHVAKETGIEPEKIFKTIVGIGDKTGYIVTCLPGNQEIDLKKIAKLSGNKSVELLHVADLEKITGYIRGGCSPIGMKKTFPTFADQSIQKQEYVYVSAGQRGLQLYLKSADLIGFCHMTIGDVVKEQIPFERQDKFTN